MQTDTSERVLAEGLERRGAAWLERPPAAEGRQASRWDRTVCCGKKFGRRGRAVRLRQRSRRLARICACDGQGVATPKEKT